MPAQELVQRERDFVGMRCAPGNNALELDGIVCNGADFHQLGLDDLQVSHRNFSMAHFGIRKAHVLPIAVKWPRGWKNLHYERSTPHPHLARRIILDSPLAHSFCASASTRPERAHLPYTLARLRGKGCPRDGMKQETMPPAEQCAERRTLWSRLVDATTEVYRATNAYDFVKEKPSRKP